MAWEQRGNQTYYYRSVRVNGRVVKEYAGGGLMGVLGEECDDERREQRAFERERDRAERERWAGLEGQTDELGRLVEALAGTALALAGYRRHDRGEWRKRRVRGENGGGSIGPSD